MQAILTQNLPPTKTKPARIKVFTVSKNMVFTRNEIKAHLAGNFEADLHEWAAKAFAASFNWQGNLVAGKIKNGYAFVFVV